MCGILGIVAPAGGEVGLTAGEVTRMRDTMTARGPDSAGLHVDRRLAVAHRRLAIRDLTDGAQPWWSDDRRVVLVYNGELYNDGELRQRLTDLGCRFRTRCDTEVVIQAYLRWGEACLNEFHGMFALGIYDYRDDRLLVARDRFGVKPLFLAEINGTLAFASSIAALLAHPGFTKQPDFATVSHYLTTFRLTLSRRTMFRGIWQLLPGEALNWQNGESRIHRYWEYPNDVDEAISYDDAVDQLDGSLRAAVRSRMTSDVPVGMFLSGGVDSNTLASLVHEDVGGGMLGVCGGGDQGDPHDFEFAARCAQHVGFQYDQARVDAATFLDCWQWMVVQQEMPLTTPSDVLIYQIARRLKQSVGVALGGEGADELLCGYAVQHWSGCDYEASRQLADGSWSHGADAATQFRQSLQAQYGRVSFTNEVDHYFALNSLIPAAVKPALLQPWVWEAAEQDAPLHQEYHDRFAQLGNLSTQAKYTRMLHQVNLESLLARLDGATMLASLEARVPYTDHRLVEQMFRVPLRHKIEADPAHRHRLTSSHLEAGGHLRSKRLLRTVAARSLPGPLANRKKASFPTPVAQWLATAWSTWAGDRLRSSPFLRETLQPTPLMELANQPAAAGMWLWPLLNLAIWGDRQFGSATSHQSDTSHLPRSHAFAARSNPSASQPG